jgi:hypothetical protein
MSEPHEITSKKNVPGGHVEFILDYCKNMDIGGELTISFIDGFIYNTTPIPINLEMGCHSVKQSIYIPRAIPVGIYSIKMLFRERVNPIKTIDIVTSSAKFEITNK